ncbi:S1/P1 nuclease [Hyalangium minutum]|uniref:Endonuclease n=1 Tax=Hyalangium minutum TaxID=394096 RepID=A0A085WXQ9_9BACT|nr:S1/P1 nuclease [Hyalangium minutum]KFE72472.1 Endonuclease [Hyalangium minutum]
MKQHQAVKGFLAATLTFWASQAHAWRETGHWAACEIAYNNVSAITRARLDALMGPEFAQQCTWPDMVRGESSPWKFTAKWHFADIHDHADYFDKGVVSEEGDPVRSILIALDMLRASATPDEMKRTWVRFLGHVVGDLHQPLHVGRPDDQGGNKGYEVSWYGVSSYEYPEILRASPRAECVGSNIWFEPITGECVEAKVQQKPVNLHAVWDFHMIDQFVHHLPEVPGDSVHRHKAYAKAVSRKMPVSQWQSIVHTLPIDWMNESRIDRATAYSAVPRQTLGDVYYTQGIVVANERVLYAGLRLAYLLDRVFDPSVEQEYPAALRQREDTLRARITETHGWGPYEGIEQKFRAASSVEQKRDTNSPPAVPVQPSM